MGREGKNDFVSRRTAVSRLNRHGVAACIVAAMIAIDAIWLILGGHSVPVTTLIMPFKGAFFLGCLAAGLKYATYIPRYHAATKALKFLTLADITTWMLWLGLYMLSGRILVLIASTPTQGGHYLADVLCGLLASALSIWIFRYVTARYGSRHTATASAPFIGGHPGLTSLTQAE